MVKFFSPAHVSGFFSIHEDSDLLRMGSIGGGICLSSGVITSASAVKGKEKVEIFINGIPSNAPVSRMAASKLMPDGYDLTIRSEIQLPIGQGFGMSGAGALTTAMAIVDLFGNFTKGEAIRAAHEAEVEQRTGLGDIAAQSVGGAVIRSRPGIPPFGSVERIDGTEEILLAVIGEPLSTRSILGDLGKRDLINKAALDALASLSHERSVEKLFQVSYEFATRTCLISPEVQRGVLEARKHGLASQAMLGNSLFAMGDMEKMAGALGEIGKVYRCSVDRGGAREW